MGHVSHVWRGGVERSRGLRILTTDASVVIVGASSRLLCKKGSAPFAVRTPLRCNKLLRRVSKLKLLANLRRNSAGGKAGDCHDAHSSDDVGGGVTCLGKGLLVGLGLFGGLVVRRLGRGLVLLPLGKQRHGSSKLNLIARGIACVGAVLCGVPTHEGVAFAHRLIGRNLDFGDALNGCEFGSLLILGTVQVVGEIVGLFLELRLGEAAVLALRGSRASPSTGIVRGPLGVGDIEGVVVLAVGVTVGDHLASGPHEFAVDVDVSFALVVILCLATKAKELRAGSVVARSRDGIIASNVENVLLITHIRVVDIQRLLAKTH